MRMYRISSFWTKAAFKLKKVVLVSALILVSGTRTQAQQNNLDILQQIEQYTPQTTFKGQVTSVNQLSDVAPNDWAYFALQSLVERYGCIVGYPERAYRGDCVLTRWEFAAGLNACLNTIERLFQENVSILKKDIDKLTKLANEFETELAVLGTRVDHLEQRVAFLEDHQFSTTTQLRGEVIFALAGAFGDHQAVPSGRPKSDYDVEDNPIFAGRVRLSFNTSFSGKDLLRVRLQARSITPFNTTVTGTNMTRLGFDGNSNNNVAIDEAFYRFPIGNLVVIQLDAVGAELYGRGFTTFSPAASSSSGSISRYGRFSPIYRLGQGGPGLEVAINRSGVIGANFAYLAPAANNPESGQGLTNGSYAVFGQLNFQPSDVFRLGLTYAHTYENSESGRITFMQNTGGILANAPFGNISTSGNHYGISASVRFSSNLTLFGWGGYSQGIAEDSPNSVANLSGYKGSKADIFYYAVGLAFLDLFKQGSLGGIIFGQPPKLIDNNVREIVNGRVRRREDDDTSYHLETFYNFPITKNLEVSPGFFVIFNPEHNDENSTLYVGTIRTTFRF